jgi:broad specificity phosphatase PhoE
MKPICITYFVHGTTVDNEKGLSSGWADAELSSLGRKQCLELKGLIKEKKFDVVFCSDLKRAVDSSKLAFGGSAKIIPDKRLREVDYGELTRAFSSKVDSIMLKHLSKPFPKGESYKDVEKRMRDFLDFLHKRYKDVEKRMRDFLDFLHKNYQGKNIAIIAHRASQLALDVILRKKTWEQAVKEDWRHKKAWKPGWEYELASESL